MSPGGTMAKKIVHVVGTGTIGEPLIGMLSTFREPFGIDEVTFNKRTPLVTDRSKVIVLGFIAQGSEFGFGKMYARGINDKALKKGQDQFIQVVSCNTHNLAVLIDAIALGPEKEDNLEEGRFVCMRRANDLSQEGEFIPAPEV